MTLRIGIVGSAGTGKSGLGRELAKHYNIPFLPSRAITMSILSEDGYDYESGVQVERFLAHQSRQEQIWKRTIAEQSKQDDFVTDRTVIDLVSYAVAELHDSDPKMVSSFFDKCKQSFGIYTHLVVCPWGRVPLQSNKIRTLNPWYQFIIHSLSLGVLNQLKCQFYALESTEIKDMKEEVVRLVGV